MKCYLVLNIMKLVLYYRVQEIDWKQHLEVLDMARELYSIPRFISLTY